MGKKGNRRLRQNQHKPGPKPGCSGAKKKCPSCDGENANAARVCSICGLNFRELKARRKEEEIAEFRERGINPTYYMNKIIDLVNI